MYKNLYLRLPGERRRPPPGLTAVIHLKESRRGGYVLHHRLDQLLAGPRPPEAPASAFLLMALGAWAGDKLLPRSQAADAWTRRIVLHLPTAAVWSRRAPELSRLLNFLTGDDWTLKLREGPLDLPAAGSWPHDWQPQAVCLLSGGLDSLVGAIDLLEQGQRLLLVSHYDFGQLASLQQTLAAALLAHYGPGRLHHLPIRVQFSEAPELTLRSRSLLFLALGLMSAAAWDGSLPLVSHEKGWISLNPPLTANRLGSYSTRTTHPHFLGELHRLWREMGLSHPLLNPYRGRTKGEMLAQCRNPLLLKELFPLTMSCSRPVVGRWQRQPEGACGYCYPCLLRRAALHRLGWDRGDHYRLDVLAAADSLSHPVQGRDLRALLLAGRTWQERPAEMLSRLFWGEAAADLPRRWQKTQRLLDEGFQELDRFSREQGGQRLRAYGQGG